MKRIRMIETRHGKHDQFRAFRYDAGKTFWFPDTIANLYISQGAAMEDKSLDAAPETKKKRRKKAI